MSSKLNVHTTTDYDKFKLLYGNREINKAHIQRIKASVKKHGCLCSVIFVNERMEIIDGQHRFEVFKELGLPINYIMKQGYGLTEVHVYNQSTKNWTLDQFMKSYADMKFKDYEVYKFFKEKYNFGHIETMVMLAGKTSRVNGQQVDDFKRGTFRVKDLGRAQMLAEMIYDFAPYYEGFRRRNFVFAIIKIANSIADYNHRQMIKKIRFQSAKLQDQVRADDYISVLEKIYNFKSREDYVRFDLAA